VWLAPFVVGADTSLAREHPEWTAGEAGFNWGQQLVGLDLTQPGVRDLLTAQLGRLTDLGVDYLKLDFLYAGALPGPRHEDVTAVKAYRSGLALIREAVGPDVYLLGCGAPILPSVGLVDAMRVSPDTFHEGGQDGSRGLRGLMSLAARAWQQGRFWVNDSDCLVARPGYALREQWAQAVAAYGGLRSFSDRIAELDRWGLDCARRLLSEPHPPTPFAPDVVRSGARAATEAVVDQMSEGPARRRLRGTP
jgi:alpha-galactosidase